MNPWIRIEAPWTWKLEISRVFVFNLVNIKLTLFSFHLIRFYWSTKKTSKRRNKKCLIKLGLKIYRLLEGRVKSVCTLTISSTHLTLLHNTCFFQPNTGYTRRAGIVKTRPISLSSYDHVISNFYALSLTI